MHILYVIVVESRAFLSALSHLFGLPSKHLLSLVRLGEDFAKKRKLTSHDRPRRVDDVQDL